VRERERERERERKREREGGREREEGEGLQEAVGDLHLQQGALPQVLRLLCQAHQRVLLQLVRHLARSVEHLHEALVHLAFVRDLRSGDTL
jgi:hypothetical protein